MPTETKYDAKKEKEPKREFAFSQEFPNEIEIALGAFDQVFKELTSISNGKITFDEEYGVVNNLYKFRYITPNDVATFASNLIKVLKNHMICPHVGDLQKFAVVCAKQYIEDHGCTPIEHSSIYGTMRYTTDNMTLRDLLVLCENDFYHTTVVSKFEMQERVKVMKKDYVKLADMHFSTNMMKIVTSLPKLITQTDFLELDYAEQKAVQEFIEEFIIFATMLNTIIMSNMIFFCVPKSTYDTKLIAKKEKSEHNNLLDEDEIEREGVITSEAVDEKATKPIYLVLVEGQAWISDKIKTHTRSKFSHLGISFEPSMRHVHSYAMNNEITDESKNKAGYCIEDYSSEKKRKIPLSVYVGFVTNQQFQEMQTFVEQYKNAKTKYSAGMIAHQLFNDDKARSNSDKKMFEQVCSTFVDTLLKHVKINVTGKNRPSPSDFEKSMSTKIGQFRMIFSGTYENYNMELITKRTRSFAKDEESQPISGEVVTECCLLKTGNIRHTAKIPFDINMRNIVLQDMHPKFKDTLAAIEYITQDSRSPIAQLLYRYGTPSEVLNGLDTMMICKMFINDPCARCGCYDEYENLLHQADFHTDVCWLDRIAFGNNFLDGNYRDDALGVEHKHPVKQTLETLYHMFSESQLKTKDELCNHILKIAHIMKGIVNGYASNGLYNWELVRDILAVLGEIMTRSMIKLYDAHMQIIASDNMDDVDAPGYMYVEAGTQLPMCINKNQDVWIQETYERQKTKIEMQENPNDSKAKRVFKKVIEFCKRMLRRFVEWVKTKLSAIVGKKYSKEERAKTEFNKNEKSGLHDKIKQSLRDGSFRPKVDKFPIYSLNIGYLEDIFLNMKNDTNVILSSDNGKNLLIDQSVDELKKGWLPPPLNGKKIAKIKKTNKLHVEYCYNTDGDFYQETVSDEAKPVYICFQAHPKSEYEDQDRIIFTKPNLVGRASILMWSTIQKLGNSGIYHAGISFDSSLKHVYSYSTHGAQTKKGTGFVDENWTSGVKLSDNGAYAGNLYVIFVAYFSPENYNKMVEFVNKHEQNVGSSKYNMNEILNRMLYKKKDIKEDDFAWVCSTFTNAVLNIGGYEKINVKSSPAPATIKHQIIKDENFRCVFAGPAYLYKKSIVDKKVESFRNDELTYDVVNSNKKERPDEFKNYDEIGRNIDKHLSNDTMDKLLNLTIFDQMEPNIVSELNEGIFSQFLEAFESIFEFHTADDEQTFEEEIDDVYNNLRQHVEFMRQNMITLEKSINTLIDDPKFTDTVDNSDKIEKYRRRLLNYKLILQASEETSRELFATCASYCRLKLKDEMFMLYNEIIAVYKSSIKT